MTPKACCEQAGFSYVAIESLTDAFSNQSYKFTTSDKKSFVLRINSIDVEQWVSREREMKIWLVASQYGVAPKVVYSDPAYRFIISDYVESDIQKNETQASQVFIKTLARFHQITELATEYPLDLKERIENYVQELLHEPSLQNDVVRIKEYALRACEGLERSQSPQGLCHLDLFPSNHICSAKACYLIDFEYSHWSYLALDFTFLTSEFKKPDLLSECLSYYETLGIIISEHDLRCAHIYMKSISWLWFQWMYKKRKERKFIERAEEIKADLEQLNPSTK